MNKYASLPEAELVDELPQARRNRLARTDNLVEFATGQCFLGTLLVAKGERGIRAILFGDEPDALIQELRERFPSAELTDGDLKPQLAQIAAFIEAPYLGLDLPLDIRGTAFQQRVWELLQKIPSGQTLSYSEVAQRLGTPRAVRAVAGACAANNLAVVIPCHRVVRSDGELSGYRWGLKRKKALLAREQARNQQISL